MLPYKIVNNNKSVVCLTSVHYYLDTILLWPVYYGNWRCHLKNNKKMVHLIYSIAQFSMVPHYSIIFWKITPIVTQLFKFHICIFKIKIRNREMYLPEVSISSTMAPRCCDALLLIISKLVFPNQYPPATTHSSKLILRNLISYR